MNDLDYDYPGGYRRKLGCWFPDGGMFVHDRNDDSGLFIWELRGGLTAFHRSGEGLVYRNPSCSTDGKYIAYQIEKVAGWDIPADIPGTYIESNDHNYKIRLTPEKVSVNWSADGQTLLFSDGDIYTAKADGSNPHKLTHDDAGYINPIWSPDGLLIAFVRRVGIENDLYLMNADSTYQHRITSLETTNSYSLTNFNWLPIGKFILYNNILIDTETGVKFEVSFPFDASSAAWFIISSR